MFRHLTTMTEDFLLARIKMEGEKGYRNTKKGWGDDRTVGSPATCAHLVRLGLLEVEDFRGPAGAERKRYRVTT